MSLTDRLIDKKEQELEKENKTGQIYIFKILAIGTQSGNRM